MNKKLEKLIEESAKANIITATGPASYITEQGFITGAYWALTPEVLIKVPEVKALVDVLTYTSPQSKDITKPKCECKFCRALTPFRPFMEVGK